MAKKAKHSYQKEKNHKFKFFLVLIFLLAIIFSIYFSKNFIYHIFNNLTNILSSDSLGSNSDNPETKNKSKYVPLDKSIKLKGASYFEIANMNLDILDKNNSNIIFQLNNTSDKSFQNVNLTIFLADENYNEVANIDYTINSINSNKTISVLTNIEQDVSNCKYYSVALQNENI